MKLCHVVPSLEEQHGGPSKSVRALCLALSRLGHEVDLLTTAPDAPPEGREENTGERRLRIRVFRRDAPQRLCPSVGLQTAVEMTDADVVHHHALWLRTLHYSATTARRRSLPLVVSPRGMMSDWAWNHHRLRKAFAQALVHPRALQRTGGWHATSQDEAGDILRRGFGQPVVVAPNGVELPSSDRVAESAAYWQKACPECATRPTALFYGRFHRKKRVLELIDVWLASAPREWLLLLVGLPEEYTPEGLAALIRDRGASDRIRVFNGHGAPPPYAVASLFLLPSHNENFGLTVAEAMAHGVPVVVTDTTPWQQVSDSNRGWCVAWNDYGATLRAATGADRAELRARGERARDWVGREYSWQRSAEALITFYRQLVRSK